MCSNMPPVHGGELAREDTVSKPWENSPHVRADADRRGELTCDAVLSATNPRIKAATSGNQRGFLVAGNEAGNMNTIP